MPTAFEKRLATLAQAQFDKYRWLRENQEPLAGQIKAYWIDLGLAIPNVAQPWSGLFVSWWPSTRRRWATFCKTTGATAPAPSSTPPRTARTPRIAPS